MVRMIYPSTWTIIAFGFDMVREVQYSIDILAGSSLHGILPYMHVHHMLRVPRQLTTSLDTESKAQPYRHILWVICIFILTMTLSTPYELKGRWW
jgi:hypothetical protein